MEAQGGNKEQVYHSESLPCASLIEPVPAPKSGYISHIACDEVGICSLILGGGRETKESVIDLSVGILLKKKKGDYVKKGEPIAVLHANDEEKQDYPIDIIIVSIGSNSGWCECGSWCFGIGLADHAAADFRMQRRR